MGTISGVAAASCTTNAALSSLGAAPTVFDDATAKKEKEKMSFFFDTAPAKVGRCKSNPDKTA
jgi:hypothetical protein